MFGGGTMNMKTKISKYTKWFL